MVSERLIPLDSGFEISKMGSNTDFIRSEMGSENYELSFKEYITGRVDRMLENFGSLFGNHPTGEPKTSPSNGSSLEKLVESVVSRKSDSPEARGYITPVTKDESSIIDSKDPYRYRKKLLEKCYPKVRKKDLDSLDMLSLDASVESSVEVLGMNEKSENGKKDFRGCLENSISRMDVISSVLLVTVKNILYPITEDVLRQVFLPYGFMEKLVIIQQFASFQALVHYKTNQCAVSAKAALQGCCIYDGCCELDIQLSILENSVRRIDEPSCNLLVTVDNMLYPITVDVLRQVFSPYGSVEEIVIVQKSVGYQALVQYQAQQCAAAARTALNGRNIYDGCCKLDIQFATLGATSDVRVHKECKRIMRGRRLIVDTGVKRESHFFDYGAKSQDVFQKGCDGFWRPEFGLTIAKESTQDTWYGDYDDCRNQKPVHGSGGNEHNLPQSKGSAFSLDQLNLQRMTENGNKERNHKVRKRTWKEVSVTSSTFGAGMNARSLKRFLGVETTGKNGAAMDKCLAIYAKQSFDPGGVMGVYERSGVMITQAQRGEQGIVYMLWEFQERIVSDVLSVLICSDGEYDDAKGQNSVIDGASYLLNVFTNLIGRDKRDKSYGMVMIRVAGTLVFTVFDSETCSDLIDWSDFELEIDKNTKHGGTKLVDNVVLSLVEPSRNTGFQGFSEVYGIALEKTKVKNGEGEVSDPEVGKMMDEASNILTLGAEHETWLVKIHELSLGQNKNSDSGTCKGQHEMVPDTTPKLKFYKTEALINKLE